MRGTKLSLVVVASLVVFILLWRPLSSRGQAPQVPPILPASAPVIKAPPIATTQAATRTATAASQAVSSATINDGYDGAGGSGFGATGRVSRASLRTIALGYPLPERRYIASGLWEVGHSELSKHYHKFSCPHLRQISRNYLYGFPTWEEGIVAGYQPDISCVAPPLGRLIQLVVDARRKTAERGLPIPETDDGDLLRARAQAQALSVSDAVTGKIFRRMIGRRVRIHTHREDQNVLLSLRAWAMSGEDWTTLTRFLDQNTLSRILPDRFKPVPTVVAGGGGGAAGMEGMGGGPPGSMGGAMGGMAPGMPGGGMGPMMGRGGAMAGS